MTSSLPVEFRDPTPLSRWLRFLLYSHMALAGLAVIVGLITLQFFASISSGLYTEEAAEQHGVVIDLTTGVLGCIQVIVNLAVVVVFLMWVYRVARNVRAMGATDLTIGPGWACGYYFIPILNLWRPYSAMKEIWQASQDPAQWRSVEPSGILIAWWLFWVMTNIYDRVALRVSMKAEGVEGYLLATKLTLVSDILAFPLTILLLGVIGQIDAMQLERQSGAAALPLPEANPSESESRATGD